MTEQTEREVLEALWVAVKGEPPVAGDWQTGADFDQFTAMLDAGAYLDAALMLVPEGWTLFHLSGPFSNTTCKATIAGCEPPKFKEGEGGTRALALCAAIEAALAREGE